MKILKKSALGAVAVLTATSSVSAHPGHGVDANHLHGEQIAGSWIMGMNLPIVAVIGLIALAAALAGAAILSNRRARRVVKQAVQAAKRQAIRTVERQGGEER